MIELLISRRTSVEIEVLRSETVYQGPVFDIRQDFLRLPDGASARIDVVDHRDSVTILPIDETGLIWFIRQYRRPIDCDLLELPAGVKEPGEDPLSSAQRELREEIGMAARSMQEIGSFYLAPGYSSEFMHVFLARDLYPSPLPGDVDEIIQIEKKSASEAIRLAESGELQDSKSIIALFWAIPFISQPGSK
jgi:ADP-ribose pyrophosphatase